jgi:hypothetical protein
MIDLKTIFRRIEAGEYKVETYGRVLLNRPPDKSLFLRFTTAEPKQATFAVIP